MGALRDEVVRNEDGRKEGGEEGRTEEELATAGSESTVKLREYR